MNSHTWERSMHVYHSGKVSNAGKGKTGIKHLGGIGCALVLEMEWKIMIGLWLELKINIFLLIKLSHP